MISFLGNILGPVLRWVYDFVSGLGPEPEYISYYAIAIIITSVIFKLLLLPISFKQTASTQKMQEIQPLMQQLQTKYKNDPQTLQAKMQALYKEHNYNPASGCLIMLVQFPILIAFLTVFREPATYAFSDPGLYETMNKMFLWIPNLENPDPLLYGLPLIAALTTFLQSKTMSLGTPAAGQNEQAAKTQGMMTYMMPIMIFWAARSFPAGLALYWVISNTFSVVQQLISKRTLIKSKEVWNYEKRS